MTPLRIHFIAIGGAAMHALAVELKRKGHKVTGSDDEIFEPSRSRLSEHGLLPDKPGWFPGKITSDIDEVILGMHARKDNPELARALEMGIRVYSYPEYMVEKTRYKKRVVIAGSHGKTTITSMIMHVLHNNGIDFDYLVGSHIDGFDNMVSLNEEAGIAVFEGDEYLASALDQRPKFHVYKPHIALISGIAWDHVNVFPAYDLYVEQFRIFIDHLPDDGLLVYCDEDEELKRIVVQCNSDVRKIPYRAHPYQVEGEKTVLLTENERLPLEIFGHHNLQNINGAKLICTALGLTSAQFYNAIASFRGAGKRLQELACNAETVVYLDFAHSPSKVKATIDAVKEQYSSRKLVACLELHTYSSLTKSFLVHYRMTMENADEAIVFYDPETVAHKRLDVLSPTEVKAAFGKANLIVYTSAVDLQEHLCSLSLKNAVLLMMSSGNFSGLDLMSLAKRIVGIIF
ncbi:MAG: peptidoglycan synthetase [Bacteroidales bacterium]|nr:peptidoglycan synthetase [Bacteroidales bacterium]MBN2762681.1 peptidoglycan synthetase [Bacteroidales bacterium]